MRTMLVPLIPALALLAGCCSSGACPDPAGDAPPPTGVLRDTQADDFLRGMMHDRFRSPERRLFLIEHSGEDVSDSGMPGWRIAGTMWGVRMHPGYTSFSLDDLDKNAQWEVDGVALAQNYGVIDMYWYLAGYPRKIAQR